MVLGHKHTNIDLGTIQISKAGGTGSGTQADTALMQTSLEDAEDNGKVLVFPPGTWLLYEPLRLTAKNHILIEHGATIKFADAATIVTEANHVSFGRTPPLPALSWNFPMFYANNDTLGGDASGTVIECYGKLDGNGETIKGNYTDRINAQGYWFKDCKDVLITGNMTFDNIAAGVWFVDCQNCKAEYIAHYGNTVAYTNTNPTPRDTGNVASMEGCNACVIEHVTVIIEAGNQSIEEVLDLNGGNFACGLRHAYCKDVVSVFDTDINEIVDINGGGACFLEDVHCVDCNKRLAEIGPNQGVLGYGDDQNQFPYDEKHIIRDCSFYVSAASTLTFSKPVLDIPETASCSVIENVFIEFEDSGSYTFTATHVAAISIENGHISNLRIQTGTGNALTPSESSSVLLRAQRCSIDEFTVLTQVTTGKINVLLHDDNTENVFGVLRAVQYTAGVNTVTNLDLGASTEQVINNFHASGADTLVANWVQADSNVFLNGDFDTTWIGNEDIRTDAAIATSKLAVTGTPDGTKFWRDDDTWVVPSGSGDALVANGLDQFASTTSLELIGVISDATGTGALVFGTAPTLGTIELGHATDTTISRSAAGVIAVEGIDIQDISSAQTITNKVIDADSNTITNISSLEVSHGLITGLTEDSTMARSDYLMVKDEGEVALNKTQIGDVLSLVDRAIQIVVFEFSTTLTTGDGKFYTHVSSHFAGFNLVEVHAEVITAGTTGTTDIQIHNVTQVADMLSTVLTIDSTETGSDTAATPAVIDISNDDVQENDVIRIDVDAVSTTPPQGLIVTLGFRKP